MHHAHAKRLTLALMVTASIVLAAAVLLWGTEYKVSLYPNHPKSDPVPYAKLLSERERPIAAQRFTAQAVFAAPAILFAALLFASSRFLREPRLRAVLLPRRWPLSVDIRCHCFDDFFFRPPPRFLA